MAIFRSNNDIIISMMEFLRLSQPELDTKPGSVARDLFVDSPARQIAELYSQLQKISNLQSLFSATGTDLSRLASNFGVSRNSGTVSTGVITFTVQSIDYDIFVPQGSTAIAKNGITYQTTTDFLISESNKNVYRSTATRLRTELDLAGITDEFAVQVSAEALTTGASGNIGSYSIISQNITGISNVTNLESFSGGSDPESDNQFRSRILAVFAGSNTGTSLGYTTAVESISGVQDSVVVIPGDPLLIRDGTQTTTDSDGNLIVSEPGTGGKVDIYVLGSSLQSQIDTYIYNDASGRNDPTDPLNDFILGQQGQDTDLSSSQRRVTLIGTENLPYQPVSGVLSVSGSSSGSNFVEKYVDSSGTTHGNFELVKDTGDLSGSSFGFDKISWISNGIELDDEEVAKGSFNGSDELEFTDVQNIREITRNVPVTDENSSTSSASRSQILLNHTPVNTVSRVVNLTTGERYVVSNQNPDGTSGELNTTGKVTISGGTLPVSTDVLQVDYTWVKSFDRAIDFDNLEDYNFNRTVQDSVDWGFGNLVKDEIVTASGDGYSDITIAVTHNVSRVVSINSFVSESSSVSSGIISVSQTATNVLDIKRSSDGAELYNTDSMGGSFSGTNIVLPSDTIASNGDSVVVRYNYSNVFTDSSGVSGSYSGKTITLPSGTTSVGTTLSANYVAAVSSILPETNISSLPAIGQENGFLVSATSVGSQPSSNLFSSGAITKNLRIAPTNLRVTASSVPSSGQITVLGTSTKKVSDALVVVTPSSGYKFNLRSAILSDLGTTSLPSSVWVSGVYSVERVNVTSGAVSSIDNTYDIENYKIYDASYDLDSAIEDSTLSATEVVLPQTSNNASAQLKTGDILRVTFYYSNSSDNESLYFSKNITQITDKKFSFVSRVYPSYGFTNSAGAISGAIYIENFNQPSSNQTYFVDYDYTAPKENERITITFNQNSLINGITNSIEAVRPITADVLVKEAEAKPISISIRIVILPEFATQEQTVLQDAVDTVTSTLTATGLGTTLDSSDVVNALYSVNGIDRVRILSFSSGSSGNVLSITAYNNEYLSAGTVDIQVEGR